MLLLLLPQAALVPVVLAGGAGLLEWGCAPLRGCQMQPLGGCRARHGMEAGRDSLGWVTSPCSLQAHPLRAKAGWSEPTGAQLCSALCHPTPGAAGTGGRALPPPGAVEASPPRVCGVLPPEPGTAAAGMPGKGHLLSSSHGNVREAEPAWES